MLACVHCGVTTITKEGDTHHPMWRNRCSQTENGQHSLGSLAMHIAAQNWKQGRGATGPSDCRTATEINKDSKHIVDGGSTRSEKAPTYHLNPGHGYRRASIRFGLGAEIHGEGNWVRSIGAGEKECRAFCVEANNHMVEHIRKMNLHEDPDDDHLGAIGWAVEVLAFAEAHWGKRWTEIGR